MLVFSKVVHPDIMRSYLVGGRTWPQKRWPIVINMLSTLGKMDRDMPFSNNSLREFFGSQPTPLQLEILKSTMDKDHSRYSIVLPQIGKDKLLEEFFLSKVGIYETIRACESGTFSTGYDLGTSGYNAVFEAYNGSSLHDYERRHLLNVVDIASDILRSSKDSSSRYRETYVPNLRDNLFDRNKGNPAKARTDLLNDVLCKIANNLYDTYHKHYTWLIYDELWKQCYQGRQLNKETKFNF